MKQFCLFWETLIDDVNILQSVKGLKLAFVQDHSPLQLNLPRQLTFGLKESEAIDIEISRLLDKGVIVRSVHETGQYVNTIFTRPKKDGSHRMILNLKPLNKFIEYRKFKMDTLKTVLQLMHQGCYLASIDISDAYYSVPIHRDHQKFLKFQWRNDLYHYTALPNGYSDAPRVFTKLLKPVFAQLRRLGHIVVGYIDDIFVQGRTKDDCQSAIDDTVSILEQCGFIIHPDKSCFVPSQSLVYLGFLLDSLAMTVAVTPERKDRYLVSCTELLQCDSVSIRTLARVIGQLVSTFPGVRYGPLHYRQMEMTKISALSKAKQDFDTCIPINAAIKQELRWWLDNLPIATNVILKGPIDIELLTDATLECWGAKCGNSTTGGAFSFKEKFQAQRNINACELLAVYLSLQAFLSQVKGKNVLIRSDNMVAITYIAHMGGTRSILCNDIAVTIWEFCQKHDIWLSAEHIAGVSNVDADYESRHVDDRLEWAIYPDVFYKLCIKFGKPEIDLFATRLNAKLDRFVSWRPEPGAYSVNAFAMSWENTYVYLFPPFSLITKCIQKLQFEHTDALLIAPLWPTQPWFSQMTQLLTDYPVMLPKTRLLYLPSHPQTSHPLRHLRLIACRLSGNPDKHEVFRARLLTSSAIPGAEVPRNNMVLPYRNGRDLLLNGILVTINQL